MIKRLFDLLLALIGLIILSPVFLIVALIIRLSSSGPIFHRGKRVGLNGSFFHIYKFRTMVMNAEADGPAITSENDLRITRVGQILRRTKVDELPQLINVLIGEMSLVGPRPEDPRYVSLYTPEQLRILTVRPGITSAASLAYRHEEKMLAEQDWERIYRTEILPAKLAIDMRYISQRTLLSDISLLIKTILTILR
jgi:lipopolysaccharide/colanic/teichoic acid biosynthesis glycosyltransferase